MTAAQPLPAMRVEVIAAAEKRGAAAAPRALAAVSSTSRSRSLRLSDSAAAAAAAVANPRTATPAYRGGQDVRYSQTGRKAATTRSAAGTVAGRTDAKPV